MWAGGFSTSPQCVSGRADPAFEVERILGQSGPTGPRYRRANVVDKSPRQSMSQKTGQSLKQKRAVKRAKADNSSVTIKAVQHKNR
jgi:hypothetical protein